MGDIAFKVTFFWSLLYQAACIQNSYSWLNNCDTLWRCMSSLLLFFFLFASVLLHTCTHAHIYAHTWSEGRSRKFLTSGFNYNMSISCCPFFLASIIADRCSLILSPSSFLPWLLFKKVFFFFYFKKNPLVLLCCDSANLESFKLWITVCLCYVVGFF